MTVLSAAPAMAEVTLDTSNPLADFTTEGGQSVGPSPTVLSLNDGSITDIINLYAPDTDAGAGNAIDIFAAFRIAAASLANADTGVHLVINDGEAKAVIAACIVQGGVKGIGLASGSNFSDPSNYGVFVPVDWSAPTTVRIRRTAEGDGEIVEVNGVPPNPRALLVYDLLSPRNRIGSTFEFGATSPEATVNVDFTQFYTERPEAELYNFSGFLQPVDEPPTLNVVGAGQAVPVKFSLSGDKGLNIFAAGYPISSQISCDANEPGAVIEETVSAGGSSLGYDADADLYSYVWKTSKAWKGSCRILALRLADGSEHFAKFRFR